ncbi:MAG TPA: GGDEF domain-containing protein [Sphingomonas sp.]|nr:GGDEF domain-containing protein [Sphingomonas sp.]
MALDLSTLYVVAGLGMLIAGMVHLVLVASGRFGRWAVLWGAGHLLGGAAAILAVVNDRIGIDWAANIGNPAAVAGYALIACAVLSFERPTVRLTPILMIAAVLAAPLIVFGNPVDFHTRIAYLSIVRAGFDVLVVHAAIRMARRESLQAGWIVAALFGITVPLFLTRGWLAYGDHIGAQLTGMHDDLGGWLAAGQIAFVTFRAFSLLILQAERGQNALLDQMERDWLTGALNRAGLDRITRQLEARASVDPIAVMMLDVDRFKQLNDTFGHAAGDAALQTLAGIAQDTLAGQGHLARWGGDEFVCLLPGVPADQARILGRRMTTRFAQAMAHAAAGDAGLCPSLSIGVIDGVIDHPTDTDATSPILDLIARADAAMYAAKGDRRRKPAALVPAV